MTADPPAAPPSKRHAARIAAAGATLAIYLACFLILLLVLSWIFGTLSRDSFGGAALLWAIYLLPALIAPAGGALIAAAFYGEAGRRAAFWPNLGLIALFTLVAILWLAIAGGFWNWVLALVQFAGGILAWHLLRLAARPREGAGPRGRDRKL